MTEENWQSVFWTDLLGDHIVFAHERELFGDYTYGELRKMHEQMHSPYADHWDHVHEWKEENNGHIRRG